MRLRQEDCYMFKTSLVYKVSSRPGRATQFIQTRATEGEGGPEGSSSLQLAQPKGSLRKGQEAEIVRTREN